MRLWLVLAFMFISLLPMPFLTMLTLRSYERSMSDVYLSGMLGESHVLADQLSESFIWNKQSDEATVLLNQYANMYHARVLVVDTSYEIIADSFGEDIGHTMVSHEISRAVEGTESSRYDRENGCIQTVVPLFGSDQKSVMAVLWTKSPVSFSDLVSADAHDFIMMILIGACAVLILMIYFFTYVIVHPVNKLKRQMDEAAHGLRDQELKVSAFNETAQMADSFNVLKNQYEVIDNSRSEFVANVSHELKTPIASMKVLADSLLQMPDAPAELYREFLQDIVSQLDRETAIIDDLLALVKLDRKTGILHLSDVNVNKMLERLIKQLGPLAHVKGVSVTLESHRNVTAHIDEVKLNLACMNVIENAIKYNRESGSIRISVDIEEQQCVIICADTGYGIPKDEVDKVFERFYRVDKSHSQQMGGSGLGLSIVRQAVEMMDGTVSIASKEGTGTIVTIRVPLTVNAGTIKGGEAS